MGQTLVETAKQLKCASNSGKNETALIRKLACEYEFTFINIMITLESYSKGDPEMTDLLESSFFEVELRQLLTRNDISISTTNS